jgi:hypothetical protein
MAISSALIFFLYTPAALWRFSTKNFLRLIKARVSPAEKAAWQDLTL